MHAISSTNRVMFLVLETLENSNMKRSLTHYAKRLNYLSNLFSLFQTILNITRDARSGGACGKVPAAQAGGPEFGFPVPKEKPAV